MLHTLEGVLLNEHKTYIIERELKRFIHMFLLDKPQNYVFTECVHPCANYCVVGNKGFWSGAGA